MTPYKLGSLFSGIGGIDLAFVQAGFDLAFQVEIDDYCNRVLARHWPDVPRFRDVRDCGAGNLPRCDVLAGGFPCQDISVAGNGAGIRAGTRSGLWYEYARIIGELRPRIVFLENVAAILTRDGTLVIGHLAEMGYDARWGVIRASDAGAPHRRERWFCVAYAHSAEWWSDDAGRCGMEWPDHGVQKWQEDSGGFALSCAEMADPARERETTTQQPGQRGRPEQSGTVLADSETTQTRRLPIRAQQENALPRKRSEKLANAQIAGLSQRGHGSGENASQADLSEADGSISRSSGSSGDRGTERNWDAESRLGRISDGFPYRLDRPRWPAGPWQSQHAWEPPRVAVGTPNRVARLKALGNSVVPQVIYPLAVAIREILEVDGSEVVA